ncbi:unnamed protein product [Diamesa tonsa]
MSQHLKVSTKNFIRTILIDNPRKKNAWNRAAYVGLKVLLNEADKDDNVKCVVITGGTADFYSSGNDLTQDFDFDKTEMNRFLYEMIESFYNFSKLLVAIVNGPAIGIACTTLALCDIIYASEKAYFYTPFTALGLCAEGCSSLTFPKILGTSKASEMLLLNHKMSAMEALQFNFVSKVYKNEQEVWEKLEQLTQLPIGSIIASKKLICKFTLKDLRAANDYECASLLERFETEEAMMAMINFSSMRKSKM